MDSAQRGEEEIIGWCKWRQLLEKLSFTFGVNKLLALCNTLPLMFVSTWGALTAWVWNPRNHCFTLPSLQQVSGDTDKKDSGGVTIHNVIRR